MVGVSGEREGGGGGGGGGVICLLGGGCGGHPPSAFCLPTTFLRTLKHLSSALRAKSVTRTRAA